jgi:hypothetical protein
MVCLFNGLNALGWLNDEMKVLSSKLNKQIYNP